MYGGPIACSFSEGKWLGRGSSTWGRFGDYWPDLRRPCIFREDHKIEESRRRGNEKWCNIFIRQPWVQHVWVNSSLNLGIKLQLTGSDTVEPGQTWFLCFFFHWILIVEKRILEEMDTVRVEHDTALLDQGYTHLHGTPGAVRPLAHQARSI